MRSILFLGVLGGLLAGCSANSNQGAAGTLASGAATSSLPSVFNAPSLARTPSTIASLPDRGELLAYSESPVRHEGAETWHSVQLSEARALRAISEGGMVVNAPNGQPIRLKYERSVEHADGNWSWIGRADGAADAPEAILTFGEKAVFGTIPFGRETPLQVQTAAGRTWLVETDQRKLAAQPQAAPADSDMLAAPIASATRKAAAAAAPKASASGKQSLTATTANVTVDLVMGYSTGLRTRLGGVSQVNTRLNFLVDVANQALANSKVGGRLRLLHALEVNYSDTATNNRNALFELTGQTCSNVPAGTIHLPDGDVSCVGATVPNSLAPLVTARTKYGADLVTLVRDNQPQQQTCGVAWVLGGGQVAITPADAAFGFSVISDSSGGACRSETLAHEVGHNLGLVHDAASAAGTDDSDGDGNMLDPNEYGRYPYSFGYVTADFYTVMSLPAPGLTAYRVFSNPRITSCGGAACGVTGQSDNALTLSQTMPVVSRFRASRTQVAGIGRRGDFNGDGKADILWRNSVSGSNSIWLSGNKANPRAVARVPDTAWVVAGVGDFNGDHRSDILWRNTTSGSNSIWLSGLNTTPRAVTAQVDTTWEVAGIADFNGDGQSDILWRNANTGANVIWKSGLSTSTQAVKAIADTNWTIAGVGDFNGDHKADILWRNVVTGSNSIWHSGNVSTPQSVNSVTDLSWVVVGVADFNGDGRADILWRNVDSGSNSIWLSAFKSTPMSVHAAADTSYNVAGVGDFNGDHKADIFWRNASSGADSIWLSGNINTTAPSGAVADLSWFIAG
ncbi:MAG: reprolysin-like metallopeptidase [Luteimonas sp.]